MEVVVNGINPHTTEMDVTGNGIHVGAIHVDQSTHCVNEITHLFETSLKYPRGVGVGDHNARNPSAKCFNMLFEIFKINLSIILCFNSDNPILLTVHHFAFKTGHGSGGRIGTVGRTGDKNNIAFFLFTSLPMIGLKEL